MCQAIHFEEKATAPRNDLNRVNVVVNHGLRKTSPWNSKKREEALQKMISKVLNDFTKCDNHVKRVDSVLEKTAEEVRRGGPSDPLPPSSSLFCLFEK